MSARIQDGTSATENNKVPEPTIERPVRRSPNNAREPGLDLTCTMVAVDFQGISLDNAKERILAGLKSLTDACGADAVFVALVDEDGNKFETVYAGRSTFSACNPDVLQGRERDELPWLKTRLEHLRLLEI